VTKAPEGDEPDGFLRTGGALRGRLWSEISAELAARNAPTGTDAATPARPEQIGPYRVLGLLGSGGMGDVFLAFDDRLQRRVAIKRIRSDREMTARARARLRREAAAAAALNHPAVVHVYDILDEPSGEAIVMEYAEGHTLAQSLAKGPLPAVLAIGLVRQVAEGLAAAHAAGLVHRDLKTQNVVVTPSGGAKILDFGISKRVAGPLDEDPLTAEGALLGTTRAMSPEQAEGRALDARSDLFSLGVLLYEVCTGRSPFKGESSLETLRNVISEPAPALADLSPALPPPLVALVGELLEKDPARRPAGAAEVAERLGRIAQLPGLRERELPDAVSRSRLATLSSPSDEPRPFARTPAVARRARGSRVLRGPVMAVAALVTVAAALAVARMPRGATPARPLAVYVPEPRVVSSPHDERSRLAAFAVRESIFTTLVSLRGIDAIGPDELAHTEVPPQDAPRAAAAEEVVAATLACEGAWCRVSLRRQRSGDGRIVADTGSFDVPSAPEDSLSLANAVAMHVRRAYSEHPPRSAEHEQEVQSGDYQRFLALRQRTEVGEVLGVAEID
jgi:serine/threonine-protein kinase